MYSIIKKYVKYVKYVSFTFAWYSIRHDYVRERNRLVYVEIAGDR